MNRRTALVLVLLCFVVNELYSNQLDSLYIKMKGETNLSELQDLMLLFEQKAKADRLNSELAKAYFLLGYRFEHARDINNALKYYTFSRKAAKMENDIVRQQRALENLGTLYVSVGKHTQAKKYFMEALELNLSSGDQLQIATSYKDIGVTLLYGESSTLAEAIKWFHKAHEIFNAEGENVKASEVLLDIGIVFKKLGKFDTSKKYYLQALSISPNSDPIRAMASNNLSEIAFLQGKMHEAVRQIKKSVVIKERIRDDKLLISGLNNLGIYHFHNKQYDSAIVAFSKSFKINLESGIHGSRPPELHEAYAYLDSIRHITKDKYLLTDIGIDDLYRKVNLSVLNDKIILEKRDLIHQAEFYDEQMEKEKLEEEHFTILVITILTILSISLLLFFYVKSQRKKRALNKENDLRQMEATLKKYDLL